MAAPLSTRVVLTRDRRVRLDGQEVGVVWGSPGDWSFRLHSGYRSARFLDTGLAWQRFAAEECARTELEHRHSTAGDRESERHMCS